MYIVIMYSRMWKSIMRLVTAVFWQMQPCRVTVRIHPGRKRLLHRMNLLRQKRALFRQVMVLQISEIQVRKMKVCRQDQMQVEV